MGMRGTRTGWRLGGTRGWATLLLLAVGLELGACGGRSDPACGFLDCPGASDHTTRLQHATFGWRHAAAGPSSVSDDRGDGKAAAWQALASVCLGEPRGIPLSIAPAVTAMLVPNQPRVP